MNPATHLPLATDAWRSNWASVDASCKHCNEGIEDVLHILRDCSYARDLWSKLIHPRHKNSFFRATLRDWFAMNLKNQLGVYDGCEWNLIWGVAIWSLWKWRNKAMFEDEFLKPLDPFLVIMQTWKNFVQSRDDCTPNSSRVVIPTSWQPPPLDWVKLNVDGALTASQKRAGCGGAIRDHYGRWVAGFMNSLGCCSVIEAEQWAILKGLRLAQDLGLRKIILESDAKNVVQMFTMGTVQNCSLLVTQIQKIMGHSWELKLQHVPREQNQLADSLAKEGIRTTQMLHSCPIHLKDILIKEGLRIDPLVV